MSMFLITFDVFYLSSSQSPEREHDCDGVGRRDNRLGFDELQIAEPAALLEHVFDGIEAVSDAQEVPQNPKTPKIGNKFIGNLENITSIKIFR